MRSIRSRIVVLAAAMAVVGTVVPAGSSGAQTGTEPYTASGLIKGSQPIFADSLTEFDFVVFAGCDVGSLTAQGLDAWVFELPADFPVDGAVATTSGDSPIYDLDLAFYNSGCSEIGRVGSDDVDETATVPSGTRFIIVKNFIGVNTTATLTVQPGTPAPEPTEEPTIEPEPSPSPTLDTRVRGVYPENPNDEYFGDALADDTTEFDIRPTQWAMRKINAPQAWQQERSTGFKINVAVIDSGLDMEHPEFQCDDWKVEVTPNSDTVEDGDGPDDIDGHGTHVAGIIGACTNNDEGVVGVAPDATLIPYQVFTEDAGEVGIIATAIRAAADDGAHVINMSLSVGIGLLPVGGGAAGYLDGFLPEIDAALDYAQSKGVVIVAAAGNDTLPLCEYPAYYEGVVCVGATDPRDMRTFYTTGPNKPSGEATLVAPGGTNTPFCDFYSENILSTYSLEHDDTPCSIKTGYQTINGTSMASPHVAGVAALIYDRIGGVRSADNAALVIEALIAGAVDLGAPGPDPIFGAGRLDALAAVTYHDPAPEPTE